MVSFRNMEELRKREIIEDYSLTQTTLDEVKLEIIRILVEKLLILSQVFVRFASEQTGLQVDETKPKTFKQKVLDKFKPCSSDAV